MRILAVTSLLFICAAAVHGADAEDTFQTRTEAAKRYAAVANMQKMLDDAFLAASQNLPEKDRAQFLTLTRKHVRPDVLESLTMEVMVKHFTTGELDALAKFYGSAEGQSALAKFGPYTADIMPLVQAEMLRAVQEMQKELQAQKDAVATGT